MIRSWLGSVAQIGQALLLLERMSKPQPSKYKTTHWNAYHAVFKSRGSLLVWLDKNMQWHGLSPNKQGRQAEFSDTAIQFCLTTSAYLISRYAKQQAL